MSSQTQKRKEHAKVDTTQADDAAPPTRHAHLEPELGTAPVTALVVVTDLAIRLHPEPVGNLTVLARLARQLLLNQERLVGRLRIAL